MKNEGKVDKDTQAELTTQTPMSNPSIHLSTFTTPLQMSQQQSSVDIILNEEQSSLNVQSPQKLLEHLVRIPSASGKDKKICDWLAAQLMSGSFDEVYQDDMSNVIARKGDGERLILLTGSLDTYRGHIPVRIEHNQLYGRGAVHAKGPLSAAISAVEQLSRKDLEGKSVVIAACRNTLEAKNNGAWAIHDRFVPDVVINLEPTGWDTMVNGYKGIFVFSYSLLKPNAHYTTLQRRSSAEAFFFLQSLTNYLTSLYPERLEQDKKTLQTNPHVEIHKFITSNNGLEESSEMKIAIRYQFGFDTKALEEKIEEMKGDALVKKIINAPASQVELHEEISTTLRKVIQSHSGSGEMRQLSTSSEYSLFAEAWPNVPMISYGPGNFELDCTPDERLDLEEYNRSIQILKETLQQV